MDMKGDLKKGEGEHLSLSPRPEFSYDDNTYSDLFKDLNGFRPKGRIYEAWENMTPAEKQAEWDTLVNRLQDKNAADAKSLEAAYSAFDTLLENNLKTGASTPAEALRWLATPYLQQPSLDQSTAEWILWEHGIYGGPKYSEYLNALLQAFSND